MRPGRSQERRIWDESGSRCQFCGAIGTTGLQLHHLDENSANTVDENLLAICGACHERYKHGQITRNDAYRVKFALVQGKPPFPIATKTSVKQPRKRRTKIEVGVNNGQVAEKIVNNHYQSPRSKLVLPGTIAENPDHYNYLEYLMERLAEFRSAGASFGQKRTGEIHIGVVRKMVKDQWGALPKDLRIEKWDALVAELKLKIDGTALGRGRAKRGQGNYHSFEKHLELGS